MADIIYSKTKAVFHLQQVHNNRDGGSKLYKKLVSQTTASQYNFLGKATKNGKGTLVILR